MSAAMADPVIAATAVRASTNFFIFNSSALEAFESDSLDRVRMHRFKIQYGETIRGSAEKMLLRQEHTTPTRKRTG